MLQTDGHRFLVESPKGLRTVSSDHVTGAPAPPARDAKCTRAVRARALFKAGDQVKEGPEFVFERFLNHGLDDDGQLRVLVSWFGFLEQESTSQLAFSLPRKAILKYCLRKRVKLPALTREGVFFSNQVGKRSLGTPVNSSHMRRKEHKKRGYAFYSLRGPRPVDREKDGAHPLRGGDNGQHTNQEGDAGNTWSPQGDQVTNPQDGSHSQDRVPGYGPPRSHNNATTSKSAGSRKGPSQPHTGLQTKNRHPPHSGAGDETADVEAPPAKPPLGAKPKSRPSAGVTIRSPPYWCPPRRYHTPPSEDGGASRQGRVGTGAQRSVPPGGGTQSPQPRCAAAPRRGSTP